MNAERGRLLGIDVGERRVGLAISDEMQTIASPIPMVPRGATEMDDLRQVVASYNVTEIVAGLPTGMSGREGPQATDVRDFAENVAVTLDLDLSYWDERLTSVQAERSLIEAGHSRKRRRDLIDSVAAAIMLQSFLDARATKAARR
ncbi:MAG: Holliday junction resolvase RuvX [Thermomicrobiales bacterium]|nr:Holliday junction resolvase RuvX [Thermomicrobiales bacterium]